MSTALEAKRLELRRQLKEQESLMVAYSGGVDSAYLAWEAHEILGERMLAVIADSPSLARAQLEAAIHFAETHSIPLRVIQTTEMDKAEYVRNDANRCFHCKDELFRVMEDMRGELGMEAIAYGRNRDDDGEFRPGQRAAVLHHAIAPLASADLGKAEIRALAQASGLAVWDKPASACLASRIEYGRAVTVEALRQVELAEQHLLELGFRQARVRHHGELARIEIAREELPRALSMEMFDRISSGLRAVGFTYVALDTEGYRSGSMNAVLPVKALFAKVETFRAS